jgi:DNA-binding GntR family transcriptional regulator
VTFSPASIAVDRATPVPLYYQVAQQFEQLIESGQLPPGTRLNNEVLLADQRRAIEYLVDRGYLVRKRGVGTQVVHPKMRRPVELTSLYDDLTLSGKNPRTSVISLRTLPATDAVAHALSIDEGTPVVALERLRYADDEPLAIMRNWIPRGLVELTVELLEQTGLYQVMRAAGIRPHLASQTVGARKATAAEARLLHATRGEPLLTMQRTTYDDAGRSLEFADHLYYALHYSFEIVLVAR